MEDFIKTMFCSLGVGVNALCTGSGMIIYNLNKMCIGYDIQVVNETFDGFEIEFHKYGKKCFSAEYKLQVNGTYKTIVELNIKK